MPAEPCAARCRDVVQVYPSDAGPVAALRGIDAEFPIGSITAVIGPSGAGKSTLLRLLAGFERPTAGEVTLAGVSTSKLGARRLHRLSARTVGYVFQRPMDNLIDYLTVREQVALALRMRLGAGRAAAVQEHLDRAGIAELASQRPERLSASDQQRVAFAVANAGRPALVIADEPSAELDDAAAEALISQLHAHTAAGGTFVIATHDPVLVGIADQRLTVKRGLLVEAPP